MSTSDVAGSGVPHGAPEASLSPELRAMGVRLVKTVAGVVCLGFVARVLLRAYVLSISQQAVIAAPLTVVQAPIAGMLSRVAVSDGQVLERGRKFAHIHNPYVDDSLVLQLQTELSKAEAQSSVDGEAREGLEEFAGKLQLGRTGYRHRHLIQLRARIAELRTEIAEASSRVQLAKEEAERGRLLVVEGALSGQELSRLSSALEVASHEESGAKVRLAAVEQQYKSAEAGVFVDSLGSGADKPYSEQRLDEVQLALLHRSHDEKQNGQTYQALQKQVERARLRMKELSEVDVVVPHRARLWEAHVTQDAYVNPGQPMVSLIDCERLMVVATVNERVFNRLAVGAPAEFEVSATGSVFAGTITRLVGAAPMDAFRQLAAPLIQGDQEYAVIVTLPGLSRDDSIDCNVGRTGEVKFR